MNKTYKLKEEYFDIKHNNIGLDIKESSTHLIQTISHMCSRCNNRESEGKTFNHSELHFICKSCVIKISKMASIFGCGMWECPHDGCDRMVFIEMFS